MMPESDGIAEKNSFRAFMPPANAPMPTVRKFFSPVQSVKFSPFDFFRAEASLIVETSSQ